MRDKLIVLWEKNWGTWREQLLLDGANNCTAKSNEADLKCVRFIDQSAKNRTCESQRLFLNTEKCLFLWTRLSALRPTYMCEMNNHVLTIEKRWSFQLSVSIISLRKSVLSHMSFNRDARTHLQWEDYSVVAALLWDWQTNIFWLLNFRLGNKAGHRDLKFQKLYSKNCEYLKLLCKWSQESWNTPPPPIKKALTLAKRTKNKNKKVPQLPPFSFRGCHFLHLTLSSAPSP